MESVYLVSLIVGGFFVLLSVLGGGDTDTDVDTDVDLHLDFDLHADFDHDIGGNIGSDLGALMGTDLGSDLAFPGDADAAMDIDIDAGTGTDLAPALDTGSAGSVGAAGGHSGSIGVVDLLSIRTLFLFAAFFGLTGVLLNYFGGIEPSTAIISTLTGLTIGVGGNYIIKKFAYQSVSSEVTQQYLRGRTGRVVLPFGTDDTGKILIEAQGKRVQLVARSLEEDPEEQFNSGDEVVIVRLDGRVAEVVKPT